MFRKKDGELTEFGEILKLFIFCVVAAIIVIIIGAWSLNCNYKSLSPYVVEFIKRNNLEGIIKKLGVSK